MMELWTLIYWLYGFVFLVIFLSATAHHPLGIRRYYINFLLKLFAFGQERVEHKRPHKDPEDSESSVSEIDQPLLSFEHPRALGIDEDNKGFHLDLVLEYITAGMASIMEDNVTKYFEPEELPMWNLLSRTNDRAYEFVSARLTGCWLAGLVVRYALLFPVRLVIFAMGVPLFCVCMLLVGVFPNGQFKRWLNRKLVIFCFDFIAGSLSLVATFHNTENAPTSGIAVANHTSPIDSVILATHNYYDMVGQKHSGLMGLFMRALSQASTHIWFERSDVKDRSQVVERMKERVNNQDLPPILIFPEGVCVNNTSVMQFKKGTFEITSVVHPIAIRFDARFGDAFWWQDKFVHYVIHMMTSWAIVCNVWYLPPMMRRPEESAIAFANRVKAKIARQGGMVDLIWDGFLKANPVKKEWLKQQQQEFARHLHLESAEAEADGQLEGKEKEE